MGYISKMWSTPWLPARTHNVRTQFRPVWGRNFLIDLSGDLRLS
jgi:hypothetical protein